MDNKLASQYTSIQKKIETQRYLLLDIADKLIRCNPTYDYKKLKVQQLGYAYITNVDVAHGGTIWIYTDHQVSFDLKDSKIEDLLRLVGALISNGFNLN